jgi:hypothetical protein
MYGMCNSFSLHAYLDFVANLGTADPKALWTPGPNHVVPLSTLPQRMAQPPNRQQARVPV